MSADNCVTFAGRAVRDAELKSVGSSKVCAFRVVNNKRIKKRDGEYGEKACFIDCEAWGPRAEFASKYVKKGAMIRVQAELEQDEWESKDGKRQKHKLYVVDVQVARAATDDKSSDESDSSSGGSSSRGGSDLPF